MVDLAGISLSVASVLFGVMIDYAGSRWAFIIGLIVAAAGNLCLALSSEPFTLILGFSLIAGGGIGPYLGAMAIARSNPTPARVISINAAMFNLSGFNYMLLTATNITRQQFFLGYCALVLLLMVLAVVLLPSHAAEVKMWSSDTEPLLAEDTEEREEGLDGGITCNNSNDADEAYGKSSRESAPLLQELRSTVFMCTAVYYALILFVGT
jgi:MFS family permease